MTGVMAVITVASAWVDENAGGNNRTSAYTFAVTLFLLWCAITTH